MNSHATTPADPRAGLARVLLLSLLWSLACGALAALWEFCIAANFNPLVRTYLLSGLLIAYGVVSLLFGLILAPVLAVMRGPADRLLGASAQAVAPALFLSFYFFLIVSIVLVRENAPDITSPLGVAIIGATGVAAFGVGVLLTILFTRVPRITGRLSTAVVVWSLLAATAGGLAWNARSGIAHELPGYPREHSAVPEGAAEKPDIVLIVVDTLRADHVSAYGYERPTTPAIDAMAAEGVLFEDTWSAAPWTRPSVASLLTGLYPASHRVYGTFDRVPVTVPLASEAFREAGYHTVAYTNNINVSPEFGFGRGFDSFSSAVVPKFFYFTAISKLMERLAPQLGKRVQILVDAVRPESLKDDGVLTDRALAEATALSDDRPLFLYLHLFGPHFPYEPPAHLLDAFCDDCTPEMGHEQLPGVTLPDSSSRNLGDALNRRIVALYDAKILGTDEIVAEVIEWLKELGRYDDTIVVVTSDHGEEFYDHGGYGHKFRAWIEQLRVPLIFRYPPGLPTGARISSRARLIDVFPTLCELADVACPAEIQGESLLPLIGGTGIAPNRVALAEEAKITIDRRAIGIQSITSDEGHYIEYRASPDAPVEYRMLYDLEADPSEQHDLSESRPEVSDALSARMRELMESAASGAHEPGGTHSDDAIVDELRALGYVE